jgi:hypothetical protein
MAEKQEWKKDIAKEYIQKNVITWDFWDIVNSINTLKEEIWWTLWNEGKNSDDWDMSDFGMTDKILKMLFNNKWKQRKESWYEITKTTNIAYYMLSEEWKKNLDILYTEMQQAKSEAELKQKLWLELNELKSEITWSNQETSWENLDNLPEMDISDKDVSEIAHIWSNRDTRKSGEKLEVDKEKRKNFLFPQWLPESKQEMVSKYLKEITVPILDKNWNEKNLTLKIHSKLANNYIAVFKELKENWIKINSSSTAAFVWRKVRRWQRMSDHSYWTAIDVNRSDNWWVYWPTNKNSEFFNSQKTVEIFKKYWFARWWDRSEKSDDPMHFTYMWW